MRKREMGKGNEKKKEKERGREGGELVDVRETFRRICERDCIVAARLRCTALRSR